jgi:hypothetical protein
MTLHIHGGRARAGVVVQFHAALLGYEGDNPWKNVLRKIST